jgi:hypothetical protein
VLTDKDVKRLFESEFSALTDRFHTIEMSIHAARYDGSSEVNAPGVYVFWHPTLGVVKVGKSQSNSKKRALEHLRDNTKKGDVEMAKLGEDIATKILLFNIINAKDLHWILSLEAFLEWNAKPIINSARMG